jgi:hypothetical protein
MDRAVQCLPVGVCVQHWVRDASCPECRPSPAVSAKSYRALTAPDCVMFPWLRREGLSAYRGLFRIVPKTVYQLSVITQRLKY